MNSLSGSLTTGPSRKLPWEDHAAERPAKRVRQTTQQLDKDICNRCRSIPWSELVEKTPNRRTGIAVVPIPDPKETQCHVCRIFASIYPTSSASDDCQLRAFSSRLSFVYDDKIIKAISGLPPKKQTVPECTILYITPKAEGHSKGDIGRTGWHQNGCIGLVGTRERDSQCGPRLLLPRSIDYGLIKRWLSACKIRHIRTCVPPRKKMLHGLRLIDCRTKSVVEAPDTYSYVAVSYVWGHELQPSATDFAPVIEDSIVVTLSLGFRYLWADKHVRISSALELWLIKKCIDQTGENKQEQIDQMDQIYSNAELTLVAAAGTDGRYGLPGVNNKARRAQKTANIGSIKLIEIPPHTSSTIRSSTWAHRGWTYQEGVLSRRRLIFTDDQVAFLCNEMHCAETANMPPEPMKNHQERDNPFIGFLPRVVMSGRGKKDKWVDYRDIKGHIMEYSRRQLSYDSDALNAILGILNSLQMRHVFGVPIKLSLPSSSLLMPLNWYHERVPRRRENFPSWSWTGWDGPVRMIDPDIHIPDDCDIEVLSRPESEDGMSIFQFASTVGSSSSGIPKTPKVIRVTAKSINITFQQKSWGTLNGSFSQRTQNGIVKFLDGFHAKLPIAEGVSALVYAYLDRETVPTEGIVGLIMGKKTNKTCLAVLLLQPHGHVFQRVGILRYREGSGTEAGSDRLPQIVHVDGEGNTLDEVVGGQDCPIWLHEAQVRTVSIV